MKEDRGSRHFELGASVVLAALLALAAAFKLMAPSYWIDHADMTWLERQEAAHSGTAGDPYEISTAAELAALAKLFSFQATALDDKAVVLTADIDLSAHEWVPIGYWNGDKDANPFVGSFDGQGHRVTGLRMTEMSSCIAMKLRHCGYGLFGEAGAGAGRTEIRSLFIEGRVVGEDKAEYGALLVGTTCGVDITNVVTSGEVRVLNALPEDGGVEQGRAYAGGLVAVGDTDTLRNCVTYASVRARGAYTAYAGGMTGYANRARGGGASWFERCVSLAPETVANGAPGGGICMGMLNSRAESCAFLTGGTRQPTRGGAGYVTVDAAPITREVEAPVAAALLDTGALSRTYEIDTDVTIPLALYPIGADAAGLKADWQFEEPDVTRENYARGAVGVTAATPGTKHFTVLVTLPGTNAPVKLKGTLEFAPSEERAAER